MMRKIPKKKKTHQRVDTNLEVCARKMEIRRQPIRNSQGDKICFKMCLSKHFCRSASTKRKQHLIRYICKSIQTKKSKMTSYQPPEPPPVFETVSLGKIGLHLVANVVLTYDTKSRSESATNPLCISRNPFTCFDC